MVDWTESCRPLWSFEAAGRLCMSFLGFHGVNKLLHASRSRVSLGPEKISDACARSLSSPVDGSAGVPWWSSRARMRGRDCMRWWPERTKHQWATCNSSGIAVLFVGQVSYNRNLKGNGPNRGAPIHRSRACRSMARSAHPVGPVQERVLGQVFSFSYYFYFRWQN
jgi:hypothetical protein